MSLSLLKKEIKKLSSKERAQISQYFFKTGKGEYGEGDVFVGLSVPVMRKLVSTYEKSVSFSDIYTLLYSKIHEERFIAVVTLVVWMNQAVKREDIKLQKKIFIFYTKNSKQVNNWDLVDVSASDIVGRYISLHMNHQERLSFINKSIQSQNLWINRIIVVSSFYQIKKKNEKMTFYITERFLDHEHDLIHKACGWMLREVGKNCGHAVLELFLKKHLHTMPRTMLRYSIERFPESVRKMYLNKNLG